MSSSVRIRILLVDDHFTVRMGLSASLELEDDFEVVAQAGNGEEALRLHGEHRPDVVVMDWRLPGETGPEVIRKLKARSPDQKVLVLSAFEGEENVYQAMEAGALGYVSKAAEAGDVFDGIRTVAQGKQFLSEDLAQRLKKRRGRNPLSPRETEVLKRIAAGRSNKEIASDLSLAEITVKQHVSSVLQKLGVQDRTQAVLAAIQRGLVSLD